ncbi:hypothetical protein [Eleftheria terrae]|uniref:hypothetical protein n=1 Tax=Eleftheria terrae TaxID=1597781 RepID=UPI00263B131B|nr:hypothetical protein [Eleftheria terrae]WKB56169.1 hypothetical protein N7L95_29445 [Eleftheria terrae]
MFRGAGDLGGAVVLHQGVALIGRGTIAALDGIDLRIENAVDVGGLRISAPRSVSAIGADPLEHVLFSRVRIDGAIRLDELDWQDGHLDTTGPVTVSGVARLSNDPRHFSYMRDRPLGKQIDTDFTFLQ